MPDEFCSGESPAFPCLGPMVVVTVRRRPGSRSPRFQPWRLRRGYSLQREATRAACGTSLALLGGGNRPP
jgi:hypothetical protein